MWWRCHTLGLSLDCQFLAGTRPLQKGKAHSFKVSKILIAILDYPKTTISAMKISSQKGINGQSL